MYCTACGEKLVDAGAGCPRCHGYGLAVENSDASMQAVDISDDGISDDDSVTGGFHPVPPGEIRRRAQAAMIKEGADAGAPGYSSCAGVVAAPLLGIGCFLMVANIWTVLFFIASIAVGMWYLVGGKHALIYGFAKPLDPSKLAGICHRWRYMHRGPCPVCQKQLVITPLTDPGLVCCPGCSCVLRFHEGEVTAQ